MNCFNKSKFLNQGIRICTTDESLHDLNKIDINNVYKIEEDGNVINIYVTKKDYKIYSKKLSELN